MVKKPEVTDDTEVKVEQLPAPEQEAFTQTSPGQPVPHAAGPANSSPVASSTPGQPVQSWLVP
jgi:hypothetical protein